MPHLNLKHMRYLWAVATHGLIARAAEANAEALSANFPASLHGAPMLMPGSGSALRRALELWLERAGIQPSIAAEIDDRALMKTFGEAGAGVFTAPQSVEADVLAKYRVRVIGRAPKLKERLYAITPERRIKHPAVSLITEAGRRGEFN